MLFHQRDADARRFRRNELVEIRSQEEILRGLDSEGKLDGVPFMPEMCRFFGQVFRVHRRTEKTCVEGSGIRRLRGAVFLDGVRCDGSAHEGCDRRCLIFWRDAWLKPAAPVPPIDCEDAEARLLQGVDLPVSRNGRFVCQSTELLEITSPLPWWHVQQYLRDLWLGEATPRELAGQLWLLVCGKLRGLLQNRRACVARNDRSKTPTDALGLQTGDLIEVKSMAEIEQTLDANNCHRGLEFTPDMEQHCGKRFRVSRRVEKIILEETGQMRRIRDTVMLEGVICDGLHARGCPRANPSYWRELWLNKVASPDQTPPVAPCSSNLTAESQIPCS